jgi:uncharacterized protein YwgA
MKIREALIIILGSLGDTIESKTKIQKLCYFLSIFMNKDFGFKAHYYGPYSQQVDIALDELRGMGFVAAERVSFGAYSGGFEVVRFDYSLTSDGKEIYQVLKGTPEAKEMAAQLKKMKDFDYVKLSIAAKSHYILKQEGKPMNADKIREKSKTFNWDITDKDITSAIDFLKGLHLAKAAH